MNALFVFPLISGNKIVVNNDDNVHIVPIHGTRHPTEAHYNNPPKQYIVYFRMLWIGATPTALEIMAISYHGFALFCNFRRIFPDYKSLYSSCVNNLPFLSPHWYGDRRSLLNTFMTRDRFKVVHTNVFIDSFWKRKSKDISCVWFSFSWLQNPI